MKIGLMWQTWASFRGPWAQMVTQVWARTGFHTAKNRLRALVLLYPFSTGPSTMKLTKHGTWAKHNCYFGFCQNLYHKMLRRPPVCSCVVYEFHMSKLFFHMIMLTIRMTSYSRKPKLVVVAAKTKKTTNNPGFVFFLEIDNPRHVAPTWMVCWNPANSLVDK
jgi:hypothetical protein